MGPGASPPKTSPAGSLGPVFPGFSEECPFKVSGCRSEGKEHFLNFKMLDRGTAKDRPFTV